MAVIGRTFLITMGRADGAVHVEHDHSRQLHALAYNLGNFMRTLALPDAVEQWSLTSLREKLIKIGAKIVRHGRYVTFQMAEVAIPRDLFADILRRPSAASGLPIRNDFGTLSRVDRFQHGESQFDRILRQE